MMTAGEKPVLRTHFFVAEVGRRFTSIGNADALLPRTSSMHTARWWRTQPT
jgi:hypothetical protein